MHHLQDFIICRARPCFHLLQKTLQRLSKIHAVSGWIAVQCYGPVYLLSFRLPFGQHFGANEHGTILAA
jgi:hypothetical protein